MGRNRVAPKVTTAAARDPKPVRMMVSISRTRTDPIAANMRIAARVGMATLATAVEKRARINNIHTPDKMDAQRVRAPTATLMAVLATEPPTASPWKHADAMLPTPCAMKLVLEFARVPSGLGALSATPAPCTSTMMAMDKAAAMTWGDKAR